MSPLSISEFRALFDPQLTTATRNKCTQYRQLTSNAEILALTNHATTLLEGGGKRLRPYLAYLMSCSLSTRESAPPWNQLIAIELFHTFCLIHDDIIDHAATRHGVATTHAWMQEQLEQAHRYNPEQSIPVSQAILLGDLVFTWSREFFIQELPSPPSLNHKLQTDFIRMTEEVILGEMLDVQVTTHTTVSDQDIYEKTNLKTARYSFVYPLQIGLSLSGQATPALYTFCETFGTALGMAFQIQDDLLDITATSQTLQKPVLAEFYNNQHTYLTQYLHHTAQPIFWKKYQSLQKKTTLTPKDIEAVHQLFHESGAVAHTEALITSYFAEAKQLLSTSPLSSTAQKAWNELILHICKRVS